MYPFIGLQNKNATATLFLYKWVFIMLVFPHFLQVYTLDRAIQIDNLYATVNIHISRPYD